MQASEVKSATTPKRHIQTRSQSRTVTIGNPTVDSNNNGSTSPIVLESPTNLELNFNNYNNNYNNCNMATFINPNDDFDTMFNSLLNEEDINGIPLADAPYDDLPNLADLSLDDNSYSSANRITTSASLFQEDASSAWKELDKLSNNYDFSFLDQNLSQLMSNTTASSTTDNDTLYHNHNHTHTGTHSENESTSCCKICFDAQAPIQNDRFTCQHGSLVCGTCSEKMAVCPFCRAPAVGFMNLKSENEDMPCVRSLSCAEEMELMENSQEDDEFANPSCASSSNTTGVVPVIPEWSSTVPNSNTSTATKKESTPQQQQQQLQNQPQQRRLQQLKIELPPSPPLSEASLSDTPHLMETTNSPRSKKGGTSKRGRKKAPVTGTPKKQSSAGKHGSSAGRDVRGPRYHPLDAQLMDQISEDDLMLASREWRQLMDEHDFSVEEKSRLKELRRRALSRVYSAKYRHKVMGPALKNKKRQ